MASRESNIFILSNAADKRNLKHLKQNEALQRSYQKAREHREQLNKQAGDIERHEKTLNEELEQRQKSLSEEFTQRHKSLAGEKIVVATKSYALRRHIEYLEGCILKKKNRSWILRLNEKVKGTFGQLDWIKLNKMIVENIIGWLFD